MFVSACVCACAVSRLLLLFLLLSENIPIFCGIDYGISTLFKHCALLWFMTYLFSFYSAYLSFGTFHFSRCQEKTITTAAATPTTNGKRKKPLALSVTMFIIWQIKVFGACVSVDNWFFCRRFAPNCRFTLKCVCFSEGKGSTKNCFLSIYYHFERM